MKNLALLFVFLLATPAFGTHPNSVSDTTQMPFYGHVASSVGLSRWHVSEPQINLWILADPLVYQTSLDSSLGFSIAYQHRNGRTNANMDNTFGVGASWENSFLQYVRYSTNGTNVSFADAWMALGGVREFASNSLGVQDPQLHICLTPTRGAGNYVTGFKLEYPNGAVDFYSYLFYVNGTTNLAFRTEQIDANGRTNRFQYETVSSVVRLLRMIDFDDRTNTIRYVNSTSGRISEVEDHYGRKAGFGYNANAFLESVTNTLGMVDRYVYDAQGFVTSYVTPYGTNSFIATTNYYAGSQMGGTNEVNRSLTVIEPNMMRELFIYRDQSTKLTRGSGTDLIPSSYPTNEVPVTTSLANTFDNTYMDARNSFHWGKREYEALSTNFLLTLNFTNLTLKDYKIATLKHWLRKENDVGEVTDTLSLIRQGSPDGTNEGAKIWFDYAGKNSSYSWCRGTNYAATMFEAVVLANGQTRFKYQEYNKWRHPTKATTTCSSGASVAQRSLTFAYTNNDIDLLTIRGPGNELLSSNAYNSAHLVLTNFNAVNDRTVATYNSSGKLTSLNSPVGLTTTNIYYTSGGHVGWLNQTIDVEIGRSNGFGYLKGTVSLHTNVFGLVAGFKRDNADRVYEVATPTLVATNSFELMNLSSTVNGLNQTNRYCFDEMARVCEIISPRDKTNHVEYCGCGSVDSVTDALNRTTFFDYDLAGRRTSVTMPDNSATFWNYDLLGQVTSVTTSFGSVTNYYNNQGLLCVVSNAYGMVLTNQYDIFDRITNSTDVNGITIATTYDLLGRVLTRTYPDSGVESYAYSAAGVTRQTNQLGKVTAFGYDAAGRMIAATNANSEVTRQVYDPEGNVTQLIDGKNQTNWFTYDQMSRLIRQTNAAGILVLTNGYDAAGRLSAMWRPALGTAGRTFFSYDQAGNLTNINHYSGSTISFEYDFADQPTAMHDAVGTTTFTYTENGELESEDGPWDWDAISYVYTNGFRKSMSLQQPSRPSWKVSYNYDLADRFESLSIPSGVFSFQYQTIDPANSKGTLLRKLIQPNGAYVTNTFNSMGRLLSTLLKNSGHTTLNSHIYTNNIGGEILRHTRTGGDYVDFTYDNAGQLFTAKAFESGGSTSRLHEQFGYKYDGAGNIQTLTNGPNWYAFTLNSLNQISAINTSGSANIVKGYTSAAATNVTVNAAAATLYSDNTFMKYVSLVAGSNTITAVGTDSLGRSGTDIAKVYLQSTPTPTYDANGNMTSDGLRAFAYDEDDRLVSVLATNAWMTECAYDGKSRRRIRRDYIWRTNLWYLTNETRYIYDGMLLVQERSRENVPTVTYTRGPDLSGSLGGAGGIGGLLARTDHTVPGSPTAYYHQDVTGNVTAMIDQSANIAAKYVYEPYGKVISASGVLAQKNRMQFSGKENDASSGLSYYGYRFYESGLGRWINEDPLGIDARGNAYTYGANVPCQSVDPFGLKVESISPFAATVLQHTEIYRNGISAWHPLATEIYHLTETEQSYDYIGFKPYNRRAWTLGKHAYWKRDRGGWDDPLSVTETRANMTSWGKIEVTFEDFFDDPPPVNFAPGPIQQLPECFGTQKMEFPRAELYRATINQEVTFKVRTTPGDTARYDISVSFVEDTLNPPIRSFSILLRNAKDGTTFSRSSGPIKDINYCLSSFVAYPAPSFFLRYPHFWPQF